MRFSCQEFEILTALEDFWTICHGLLGALLEIRGDQYATGFIARNQPLAVVAPQAKQATGCRSDSPT